MNQTILDTENNDVKHLIKATAESVQFWKQTTSSTGEVPTDEGETTETITIIRTLLTTNS